MNQGVESQREEVAFLDASYWSALNSAAPRQEFLQSWLVLLCRSLSSVSQGAVFLHDTDEVSVGRWPEQDADLEALLSFAHHAMETGRGVVQPAEHSEAHTMLAYPMILDDQVLGVAALSMRDADEQTLRITMRRIQWASAWLRERLLQERLGREQDAAHSSGLVLDVIAVALEQDSFRSACAASVSELASQIGCDRVSLGWLHSSGQVRIEAISNTSEFRKQMNLVRLLGEAMDESLDQRCVVQFPSPAGYTKLLTRAHESLSREQQARLVLTFPMAAEDNYLGAVLFEFSQPEQVDDKLLVQLDACVAMLTPIVHERWQNRHWLGDRSRKTLAGGARFVLGPEFLPHKVWTAAAVLLIAVLALMPADYRITADAAIEGRVQRAVVAAFDGYVSSAEARAGDVVEKGQLLATLDDRDLQLRRLYHVTERAQKQREYQKALSERGRTATQLIQADIEKVDAEIALVDAQIERTELQAPFAGLIVEGDLSQSIGAPSSRGDVLFRIAPLEEYRVILRVAERDLAALAVGQAGELIVAALPGELFGFKVTNVTAVTIATEGQRFFRVEGQLLSSQGADRTSLRPGMEGAGKITVDRRSLLWIWTHSFFDWLSFVFWRWLP